MLVTSPPAQGYKQSMNVDQYVESVRAGYVPPQKGYKQSLNSDQYGESVNAGDRRTLNKQNTNKYSE